MSAVVVIAFIMYFFVVLRPTGFVSANSLFLYIQLIMALGTFPMLDSSEKSDVVYAWILVWALLSYMAVSAAATLYRPVVWRHTPAVQVRTYHMTVTMKILIAISAVIMIGYYYSVGSSALVAGISNSLTGGDADIAGQRLSAYAGDQYFFPGYVNQFKNALLPALIVVLITEWFRSGPRRLPSVVALSCIGAFGLLGTGQRGAFVMFVGTIFVYLYMLNGRKAPKGTFRFGALAMLVVLIATIALGRNSEKWSAAGGLGEKLIVAFGGFVERVFNVQQESAVYGFRYIYQQEIQYGVEWANSFLGILPGFTGSDLSNEIFATWFGTDRGTAPPSLWGSVFYNFGYPGMAVIPALLAFGLVYISRNSMMPRQRNTFEVMGIAGTSITLGMWASNGPVHLLNAGLVVYLWMWWWGARIERDHAGRTTEIEQTPGPRSISHWGRKSLGIGATYRGPETEHMS